MLSGGVGAGKTTSGAVEALRTMLEYPGSRGLIGRFTDPELRNTSWYEFRCVVPEELIEAENKADLYLRLKNKSEAMGMHLQEEFKVRSLNLGWAWIDEGTEIRERLYQQLVARLRHPRGPRRLWVTTNPDTRSSYLYRLFLDGARSDHEAFHIRTSEATFLPPDYIASVYEMWDSEMAQKFLEGRWDAYEGLVFPMFDREQHVLPWRKADVPRDWPRYRSIDHGWSDPAVCVFAAVGPPPDSPLVVYDVYYRKHRTIREIVTEVKEMSIGHSYQYTLLDPRADVTQSATGRRMSEEYARAGLPVMTPKRQNIAPGIARMRMLMEVQAGRPHLFHRIPGTDDPQPRAPRLYVCAHCVPLIKELFDYRYPPEGGETPIDKANHAIDALRYMTMASPQYKEAEPVDLWAEHVENLRKELGVKRGDRAHVIGNEMAVR